MVACAWQAYRAPATGLQKGWGLTAVAMMLWATGMALSAWLDLNERVGSTVTSFSDLFYFVYGAPLLLAISSARHHPTSKLLQWLDAIQILLATYLAYVTLFSQSPFTDQSTMPMQVGVLVKSYDVENLVLACCATLRLIAHKDDHSQEGHFYKILALFLWMYAVCATLYNHAAMDGSIELGPMKLLPEIPFLTLTALALLSVRPDRELNAEREEDGLALMIDNFSPIFFTAALVGLGFSIAKQHSALALASVFVALTVYALRMATLQSLFTRAERSLRRARDELERMTLTDGLTGIANRRCFDQVLETEWRRGVREERFLSLLMIDIDHFKSLNDHFGHQYGDACLTRIAQALKQQLPRSHDLAARYGGEEFAAILPETDHEGAEEVARRVLAAVCA